MPNKQGETRPNQGAFAMPEGESHAHEWGLSKREYFACHILAGLPCSLGMNDPYPAARLADIALARADALIVALNKPKE